MYLTARYRVHIKNRPYNRDYSHHCDFPEVETQPGAHNTLACGIGVAMHHRRSCDGGVMASRAFITGTFTGSVTMTGTRIAGISARYNLLMKNSLLCR